MYELSVFDVGHSIDYIVTDMVPFDAYGLTVFVFVIDKATNRSLPIATFAAGEGPDNFVVSSSGWSVKSNYTYDSGTGPTTVEVESSLIYIEARESQLAQAFTMCMLLVNWALTVGSTYITLLVIFRGEGTNEAVLLLPVTIVLTIPTIRSLYVGSPPFGIFIGKPRALVSHFKPGTDAALRYIRILLADDDSCGMFHGIGVCPRCFEVHVETTSLPR